LSKGGKKLNLKTILENWRGFQDRFFVSFEKNNASPPHQDALPSLALACTRYLLKSPSRSLL